MKKLMILTMAFLMTNTVFADQCAYVSKYQAKRAVKKLAMKNKVYSYCEPCGDTKPKEIKIQSLGYSSANYENFYEVSINGKGVDLAYTYNNRGVNMAFLSRCKTESVSRYIKVK